MLLANHHLKAYCFFFCAGTSVFQVTASDADDPTYGNSAKIVYSILDGQPYFSVDPKTGRTASVFTYEVLTATQGKVQTER